MKIYRQGMFFTMLMMLALSITFPGFCQTTTPPASPVRLIFIHHSTGGHWLADTTENTEYGGGLGRALMNNNYYVSATNYCWDAGSVVDIGSRTDVVNWPEWFTGPDRDPIMAAVYAETGQNFTNCEGDSFGAWPRLATAPSGPNEIIMFKSCFPNSDIYGNPDDPALPAPNEYDRTVENYKAVYNNILQYFAAHQEKLFVVIIAPPLSQKSYELNDNTTPAAERAANARAFTDWLLNDWLAGYAYNNVAVFNYYNILTSNGGDVNTNDAGWETGNHHRWRNNQVQYLQTVTDNYAAYPYYVGTDWADDHPTSAGQQKATTEFVPLLNYFYNRWKGGSATSSYLLWTK